MTPVFFMRLGAMLVGVAILLGAFAAHALKGRLSDYALSVLQTGVNYHMYHALALVMVAYFWKVRLITNPTFLVLVSLGILFFSGSLYLLAFTGIKKWGMVTPIGGLCFVFGWFSLLFSFDTD